MEELMYEFGNKKAPILINLTEYKGRKLIDIRKFFLDSNGDLKPTKKGISLNPLQLSQFFNIIKENQNDINSYLNAKLKLESEFAIYIQSPKSLIGRSFSIEFEGSDCTVSFNDKINRVYNEDQLQLIGQLLVNFYLTLIELYDEDEINLILDIFDTKQYSK